MTRDILANLENDTGFVVDIPSKPSTTMTGIEVVTLEHDLQPPILSQYIFDFNSGIFILNFTESNSQTNFSVSRISVQG